MSVASLHTTVLGTNHQYVATKDCEEWLTFPQFSYKGKKRYGLGDPKPRSSWHTAFESCNRYFDAYFGVLTPQFIIDNIKRKSSTQAFITQVTSSIRHNNDYLKLLSSCIVAYGMVLSDKNIDAAEKERLSNILHLMYTSIYNMYELTDKKVKSVLVPPEGFLELKNSKFDHRTTLKTTTTSTRNTFKLPPCKSGEVEACAKHLSGVPETSPLFSLANIILCYCNLLKTKYKDKNYKDYSFIISHILPKEARGHIPGFNTKSFGYELTLKNPTKCDISYYLNYMKSIYIAEKNKYKSFKALFKKSSMIDTPYFLGDVHRIKDGAYAPQSFLQLESHEGIRLPAVGPGPVINILDSAAAELLETKLFIENDTLFKGQRYIVNSTKEEQVLDYTFIGIFIKFLLINQIKLPFKLSRAYLLKMFRIFDFSIGSNNIYEQLTLITIYILESGEHFKNFIFDILKVPEILNKYDDPISLDTVTVMMNHLEQIVKNNRPIYDKNPNKLYKNVIDFLYKNAVIQYFDNKNATDFFKTFYTDVFGTRELPDGRSGVRYAEWVFKTLSVLDDYVSIGDLTMDIIEKDLLSLIDSKNATAPAAVNDPTENVINIKNITYLKSVLRNDYTSDSFKEAFNTKFAITEPLKDDEYHIQFVKNLLKFWTSSSQINSMYRYAIDTTIRSKPRLPTASTCSQALHLYKNYTTINEMFEDLVRVIVETGFGEDFGLA